MNRSYINSNQTTKNKDAYHRSNSYLSQERTICTTPDYALLPEEYSIFSEIDCDSFERNDTAQNNFLALCLRYMKSQIHKIYAQYGVIRVLPKLSISSDEDDAIVLNWAYANFRIYFNFEKIIENSYYGIVAYNMEETMFTNSGRLTETNYPSVIDRILAYVIDNS